MAPLTYESQACVAPFTYVEVPVGQKIKRAIVIKAVPKPHFTTRAIAEVTLFVLAPHASKVAQFIASYYLCSLGEACGLFIPNRSSTPQFLPPIALSVTLSSAQQEAYAFVKAHPMSLLFGDTGSGKTEIYIHYIHDVMHQKKQSLFLMPEISLTPQMELRLTHHFGEKVAIWHSKITPKRKEKILEGIANGTVQLIAGPRSILFLPLDHLGLIIVDEEHDDSYKSNQKPRYHARDIAMLIATQQNIPLLLGSATPSLASFVKLPYFRLKGSFYEANKTIIFEPCKPSITPLMHDALKTSYTQKDQSLVFVPTRANFKYLTCASCGSTVECPHCSVAMSIHAKKALMQCHYCNFTQPIARACPKCHFPDLVSERLGTAEVVRLLKETFPNQSIAQFDRDTITTDKVLKSVLKAFNEGEIQTIVGTQMLSKGHDYHDITLALVLGMDHILAQSDFRAREKALGLLIQIIGRAGRKKASKVIVQSFNEAFFRPYLNHYEAFLEEEALLREGYYPPFTKLGRILFAHTKESTAQDAMHAMVKALKAYEEIEIIGYGKAGIEKIANKYRYAILLRARSSKPLLVAIKATLHPLAQVDIDPIEFT